MFQIKTSTNVRHIITPRKIELERSTDQSRVILKPYFNQVFWVEGEIQRISRRGSRLFMCLTKVRTCTYADSLKPEEERTFLPVDHVWSELTGTTHMPAIGSVASNIARVISYKRMDGSWSYGFRPYVCNTLAMGIHTMVVRITDQIGEKPTDRLPYKGIIQKEVIHFRKELNQGYYVKNYERIYFILPLGLNNAFAYVQKVEKRMLKHAKNGEIKQLDNFFGELVDVSKNIVKGQTRIIAS